MVFQCFWHSCLLAGCDILIILILIMMIMIIKVMILYTFEFSSFWSHVTCFQEWCCEMCNSVFHFKTNYDCHKKICCGIDMYCCYTCGNVYKSKKSLWGHQRKHHIDDVCHFTFFCGKCELNQLLAYMMQMWIENFSWFTCYGIVL